MTVPSPRWSPSTKRLVITSSLILVALFIYRFRDVIMPLVVALLLAYILSPLVALITRLTRMPRTLAVVLVYLALVAALIIVPIVLVPRMAEQVTALGSNLPKYIAAISTVLSKPIHVGPYEVDLSGQLNTLTSQLAGLIQQGASQTVSILSGVASFVTLLIFVLLISFYMLKDAPVLLRSIERVATPEYRYDLRRLLIETGRTWNAFLRGQLILALTVGAIVAVVTTILGIRNSLILGILSALGEFLPVIGPGLAAIPGILLAYFQGSAWLTPEPLSNLAFAGLVLLFYVINQQVENSVLVPRIIGRSLDLHPLVILTGVVMGASLAGIVGILLAAPTLATLRLLARYVYHKLLDQDPFPEEAEPAAGPAPEPQAVAEVATAPSPAAAVDTALEQSHSTEYQITLDQ